MEDFKKTIVVPWDFSEKAEFALAHAFLLKPGAVGITLVHIVEKTSQIAEMQNRLEEVTQRIEKEKGFKPKVEVRKGNIFKHLGRVAEEVNAILVVMGVHDVKLKRGLKVVLKSPVPFILVKDMPRHGIYDEIVVPMNEDKKNRILLNWVIILSKYYNCNVDILKPFLSSSVRNEKMRGQMFFIRKNLDSNGIVYGIKTTKRDTDFYEESFKFLDEIGADMMLLMSHSFKKFVKKAGNNNTPILVLNPMKAKMGGFN